MMKRFDPEQVHDQALMVEYDDGEYVRFEDVAVWVSVEDGLPRNGQIVLGWADEHGYFFGHSYIHERLGYRVWKNEQGFIALVTHWMPLPEAPK